MGYPARSDEDGRRSMSVPTIRRGMRVVWKPEWRSPGDEKYTFVAVTDEHPIDHGFDVSTIEGNEEFFLRPIQTGGRAHMVESAVPYLPIATLTFVGLAKKGARVQLRRMLGDRELSLTEETIALSTFRELFGRFAKDCKAGAELRSGVEFPDDASKKGVLP
jgi:hypothetical protein